MGHVQEERPYIVVVVVVVANSCEILLQYLSNDYEEVIRFSIVATDPPNIKNSGQS